MKGDPFKTNRYELFSQDIVNRNVANIKKLMISMKRYGFIKAYPLHVVRNGSGGFIIKDGGHRFAAAKELGLEVYYVVCQDDNISIPEINNTQRSWKMRDYVDSHAKAGNHEYIKLRQFHEDTGIPMQLCARLLYGEQARSGNADRYIKAGQFRVKNYDYALRVASIVNAIGQFSKLANNIEFVNAISRCCLVAGFHEDRFIKNAQRCAPMLVPQATLDNYMDLCEAIYNDHMSAKNRIPLKFEANIASAKRNAVTAAQAAKGKARGAAA